MKTRTLPAFALALVFTHACAVSQPPRPLVADLVLRGGKIFVADEAGTVHEALAARDGRIIAVGRDDDVARLIGAETRVVELAGRLVTPGFNDAHLHFAAGGVSMLEVNLSGATSLAEIERRVREAARKAVPGEWITGRGWDHTRLPLSELGPGGWPTRAALDRAAPAHPVYLRRVDGHTGWANSRALALGGVSARTPNPPGGEIVKDPATGEPTGIVKEDAQGLVARVIPPADAGKLRRGIEAALAEAARTGVTSIQTSATPADLKMYRALRDAGRLTVRVYAWLPLTEETIQSFRRLGVAAAFGDPWLRIGLLKGYVDGTLGSRTAWMLEPFADDATRGIQRISQARLDSLVIAADAAGLQLAIHAIGDAGNRMVLDAFEAALEANGRRDSRHRVEHAQVLDRADMLRFRELGAIASMQPTHATSDMRWVETRIGRERAEEGAYAWRKLLNAGARVIFGTDFAVEPLPPAEGLYSAVTRQSREQPGTPPGGWIPSEKLGIAEAIRLYTAASAFGEFQEQVKGALERGKLADLVVWDRDLLTIPPAEILRAQPALTIVDGRVVYQAPRVSASTAVDG